MESQRRDTKTTTNCLNGTSTSKDVYLPQLLSKEEHTKGNYKPLPTGDRLPKRCK